MLENIIQSKIQMALRIKGNVPNQEKNSEEKQKKIHELSKI